MDRHENHVAAGIDEFDRFLRASAYMRLQQAPVLPHSMVDMHHIVADTQRVEVVDGHLFRTLHLTVDRQLVVTFKYLMVCVVTAFG